MKKKMAVFLAGVLALAGVAPVVMAEEGAGATSDNPVKFSYEDIDESVYEGEWVETGLGFDVYLPTEWVNVEIDDEMYEAGLVFQAGEEGGGANLTITSIPLPDEVKETYTIDTLGTELAASNTQAMFADLNGFPAVVFDNDTNKTGGFCMLTEDSCLITGVISPPSDDAYEDFGPYFMNIIMSVSTDSDEETITE